MERTIETQRLRLLRLVAGLFVVVGFLSVGPVSRSFSLWARGFIGPILSRAEAAVGYLVIAQARRMAARTGDTADRSRFSVSVAPEFASCERDFSLWDARGRLKVLQAVLTDLPRYALRLLRRIEKQRARGAGASRSVPRPGAHFSALLCDGLLARNRIERPPDKIERQINHACQLRCPSALPPVTGREAMTVGHVSGTILLKA